MASLTKQLQAATSFPVARASRTLLGKLVLAVLSDCSRSRLAQTLSRCSAQVALKRSFGSAASKSPFAVGASGVRCRRAAPTALPAEPPRLQTMVSVTKAFANVQRRRFKVYCWKQARPELTKQEMLCSCPACCASKSNEMTSVMLVRKPRKFLMAKLRHLRSAMRQHTTR